LVDQVNVALVLSESHKLEYPGNAERIEDFLFFKFVNLKGHPECYLVAKID
jgi:hypothetical protein